MHFDRSPGTLLVLDYPGRRREGRIRDLDLERFGWRVRHLVEPPLRGESNAAGYAERLLDRRGSFPDTRAVLAYCTGAAVAQQIANRLDSVVPLVLFDGTPVTPALIVRDFAAAMSQVGGRAAPDAAAQMFDPSTLATRPADVLTWMRDELVDCAAAALRADGVPETQVSDFTAEICGVYLDWLQFLLAAHNTDWPKWGGDVVHIVSDGHVPVDWPGAERTEVHRVASTTVDLLRHPAAQAALVDCLGEIARDSRAQHLERMT